MGLLALGDEIRKEEIKSAKSAGGKRLLKETDSAGDDYSVLPDLWESSFSPLSEIPVVPSETPELPSATPAVSAETPDLPPETPDLYSEMPAVPSGTTELPSDTADLEEDAPQQQEAPQTLPAQDRLGTGLDGRAFGEEKRIRPRSSTGNTLAIMNMRKRFGRREVVKGVGFSMEGGEVAGLLGPNGAGKTTTFYMIVGFYKPDTGDVKLNGISLTKGPMYKRARLGIAYLPQEASIFKKLSVEKNIWAVLEPRRDIDKKQKKQKLEELIEDFGIGRIRKQYGYTLSGGERRRTEIARALAIDPKFILLDEPFAGIDPIAVYEIKQIIKRLAKRGIGILITDHNVRDTLEITTNAYIINQGIIVARGNRDHILTNQIVRDVYLGAEFRM